MISDDEITPEAIIELNIKAINIAIQTNKPITRDDLIILASNISDFKNSYISRLYQGNEDKISNYLQPLKDPLVKLKNKITDDELIILFDKLFNKALGEDFFSEYEQKSYIYDDEKTKTSTNKTKFR